MCRNQAFYTVEVHIDEKEQESDLHFEYHNITNMRFLVVMCFVHNELESSERGIPQN